MPYTFARRSSLAASQAQAGSKPHSQGQRRLGPRPHLCGPARPPGWLPVAGGRLRGAPRSPQGRHSAAAPAAVGRPSAAAAAVRAPVAAASHGRNVTGLPGAHRISDIALLSMLVLLFPHLSGAPNLSCRRLIETSPVISHEIRCVGQIARPVAFQTLVASYVHDPVAHCCAHSLSPSAN